MNEQNVPKRKSAWLKCGVIAGCVVLLLALGFGVYMLAKPKENAPIASTPTTGATEATPSTESTSDTKLPENNQNTEGTTEEGYVYTIPDRIGYHYRLQMEYYETDPDTNRAEFKQSIVERYNGEELIWRTPVPMFRANTSTAVSDGVVVYGRSGEKHEEAWIAKFSDAGQVLWQQKLDNGLGKYEAVKAVVENADGSYSVFTTCDVYFCMHKFSADGQHILFQKNEVEDKTFGCVTQVGDGYWVQLGYIESHIVRLDKTGKMKIAK